MATVRNEPLVIRRIEQLEALRTPLRHQIVQALEDGPRSVKELAERLHRIPESLYYHVNKLVEARILVEVDRRPVGRKTESLYGLAAPNIAIDEHVRSAGFLAALGRLYSTVLRATDRALQSALVEERRRTGPRRMTDLRHWNVPLTPSAHAELRRRLDAIEDFIDDQVDRGEGDVYSLTTALAFVGAPRRRRGAS